MRSSALPGPPTPCAPSMSCASGHGRPARCSAAGSRRAARRSSLSPSAPTTGTLCTAAPAGSSRPWPRWRPACPLRTPRTATSGCGPQWGPRGGGRPRPRGGLGAFRAPALRGAAPGNPRPGAAHGPQAGRGLAQGGVCIRGKGCLVHAPPMTPKWKAAGSYSDILYHKADGIAKVTINRPQKRNAFRPETVAQMIEAFTDAREDPSIGVVLLTGAGPHTDGKYAFCSGGDQSVRGAAGYVGKDGVPRLNVLDLQKLIRSMPKVVIALVAGYAIGGGHVLHVVCDLTLAADNAVFGQVGPSMGSFDGGFGSSYLARIVGQKKAREIWFLCRKYTAAEALAMGLVNTVVPLSELEAETTKWCRE